MLCVPRLGWCSGLVRSFIPGLIALSATAVALAGEVTVKNDSFVSGGSTFIVGDFIPGEHAGVVLTSPCAGNIVAVQVAWFSNDPGAQQTIERAIHIYASTGGFPTPGSQLLLLEAPLLTPGFLNEFRYVDENNTIPINVPVTNGQKFFVTLEFDNPTDIVNGTPSIIRDVNGCQAQKNVLFAIPGGWLNFCTFLAGDVVIRAIVNCPDPTGACCMTDGSCSIKTSAECAAVGGTYKGDGVTCANANCPQPTGACCFQATGGCLNLSSADCAAAGGIFKGGGTNCGTTVCFPKGACCLPDGSCLNQVSPETCSAQGGIFQGNGTNCGTTNCPPPVGACCFGTGGCLVLSQANCAVAGGSWKGFGTDCADHNGNGHADACEAAPPCAACDVNCDGTVNLFDITPFVDVLQSGSGCSSCAGDTNHDGSINLFDIQGFMNCLGG